MLDDVTTGASAPLPRCMWCSAELPSDNEVTCPSCGATLIGEGDTQLPGVTAIDAEAIVRAGRPIKTSSRSRLMSWISGDYDDDADEPAPPGSLSPPPPEVRREILRLELEAQVANLQAEADSMAAEAAVESGVPIEAEADGDAEDGAVAPDDETADAAKTAEAALAAAPAAPTAPEAAAESTETEDKPAG
jgi:hypothetical protein